MMNYRSEQPHSRPRVTPTDELRADLLTRERALAHANLLFFLSSLRLQGLRSSGAWLDAVPAISPRPLKRNTVSS
jgi:hypothetical protein